jgi:WD40 repeat protein
MSGFIRDARLFAMENFEVVKKHPLETYSSALVWTPRESMIRKQYIIQMSRRPRVVLGLRKTWDACELTMRHGSIVSSVAFSNDGSRVVSGSYDRSVRIWNAVTGECEVVLEGHSDLVTSVAFSNDGSRVVSGSWDKSVRIWNAVTGECEVVLEGHSNRVRSVAFSNDGSRVVSGSGDKSVRIWNAVTGECEVVLNSNFPGPFKLPDQSQVQYILDGQFQITNLPQTLYPLNAASSSLSLSKDRMWIYANGSKVCWIPSRFRAFTAFSSNGSKICFGFPDGRVVLLESNFTQTMDCN